MATVSRRPNISDVASEKYEMAKKREKLPRPASCGDSGTAADVEQGKLPPFPKADARGCFPALEYARVSLARKVIRARKGVGLSQQKLADLAGLRQESISRLEGGKCTARPGTVDKIMRVIESRRRRKSRRPH